VPPTCCNVDYDALFDERMARRELDAYRRKGAEGATRRLVEALLAEGVEGATLLDIGGGIGVIQHELLADGASSSLDVEASRAYLAAARREAERRGFGERAAHRYGDFVELAHEVEPADIVTLDRVICCYPDMAALVGKSVERARRLYALVYPVDRWWIRFVAGIGNGCLRLFRQSFRFHVHPTRAVDRLVRSNGFERRTYRRGLLWQMAVYRRVTP
jgi:magnesium-protoporphyrin O-methyltransferase